MASRSRAATSTVIAAPPLSVQYMSRLLGLVDCSCSSTAGEVGEVRVVHCGLNDALCMARTFMAPLV